jgi:hypothetical protein
MTLDARIGTTVRFLSVSGRARRGGAICCTTQQCLLSAHNAPASYVSCLEVIGVADVHGLVTRRCQRTGMPTKAVAAGHDSLSSDLSTLARP